MRNPVETMTPTRVEYRVTEGSWRTPGGHDAVFAYREDTSDWNTLTATMAPNDEYGLGRLSLSGLAIDIGGYLGSVGIGLALDNPDLRVLIVEAIGENAELIRRNVALNHVEDRVTVIHAAAAAPDVESVDVFWRAQGTESFEHHAFVGNSTLVYSHGDTNHETETVRCVSLSGLTLLDKARYLGATEATEVHEIPALLKIDCEGCEWSVLKDPAVAYIPLIVGEWHNVLGKSQMDIVSLLPDHAVSFGGTPAGPGGFRAVLR